MAFAVRTYPLIAGAFALLAASCGELLGTDDYRIGDSNEGDSASVTLPILPALPDPDFVPGCEECVLQKCDSEYADCRLSERCRDMLVCQGECSDPNCLARCTDLLPRSVEFEDYFNCAFNNAPGGAEVFPSRCPEECNAGRNWACAGGYTWDPRTETIDVTARVRDVGAGGRGPIATLAGVSVAACDDFIAELAPRGDANCGEPFVVDGYGVAELSVKPTQAAFAIVGGAGQKHRVYPRHLARTGLLDLLVFAMPPSISFLTIPLAGSSPDPSVGILTAHVLDCLGTLAVARVESPGIAPPFHVGTGSVPGSPPGSSAVFIAVPPARSVTVAAYVDELAEPLVASTQALVAAGWQTTVLLYPRN